MEPPNTVQIPVPLIEWVQKFVRVDVVKYWEFDQEWHQCPRCLWISDSTWDLVHDRCDLVDAAFLLGLPPKGVPSEEISQFAGYLK